MEVSNRNKERNYPGRKTEDTSCSKHFLDWGAWPKLFLDWGAWQV